MDQNIRAKKLSIIIPAYNEEHRITETLFDIHNTMQGQLFDYEILVVNDGSRDNTADVVEALQKQISKLYLINNSENHGKGWVIKQGMFRAVGNYRLFMDADNSTRVQEITKMLPYLQQGFDVVIGSRYIKESDIVIKQPWVRSFPGKIFRIITHILIPTGVTDLTCGFKIFSEKAVNVIFPQQTIFRWSFDVELLFLAKRNKLKIKEIPVIWMDNNKSRVKFRDMVRSFFEIIQIRLRVW
ncbi:MAG: dolichyl-phosphate beta-glucosyltransferase [Candidatus Paceibacterota bacterium]|jgi:glycosyltransferase involved in cell wall biosynthesis